MIEPRLRPRHARTEPLRKRDLPGWVSWPIVGVLTATSALLSFFDLTKRSLWLDEGYTWLASAQTIKGVMASAKQQGYHLIPYELVVHWAITNFGASSFVLRTPSVIAGAIGVPLFYLLVARLGGRLAGVYASILYVVSEPLVYWQQNARDYSFVVTLAIASTLAVVVAMQDGRVAAFLAWAVLTGIGCYTHPEMLLLVPPQVAVMIVWTPSWRRRLVLLGITAVGGLGTLSVVGYAVHAAVYETTFIVSPNQGTATEIASFLASAEGSPVTEADHALLGITFGILVVAVALLGWDLVEHGCTPFNLGLGLSTAWLVIPYILLWIVSETGHPDFIDRYLMVSLPACSAMVALVLIRLEPRLMGMFVVVYLTIFRAGLLIPSYHSSLEDYRDATKAVLTEARPDDCITFSSNLGRLLWDYYSARDESDVDGRFSVPTQVLPPAHNGGLAVVQAYNNLPDSLIVEAQSPAAVAGVSKTCKRIWLFESQYGNRGGSTTARERFAELLNVEKNLSVRYHPKQVMTFTGVIDALYIPIPTAPKA